MSKFLLKYKYVIVGQLLIASAILSFQNCARDLVSSDDEAYVEEDLFPIVDPGLPSAIIDEDLKTDVGSVSPMMMDRFLLRSLFVDIFGPSIASHALLLKIESDLSVMGSPCSFADNFIGAVTGDRRKDFCDNSATPSSQGATLLPASNVLRAARIGEFCYLVSYSLDNADGVTGPTNYLINKLKNNVSEVLPGNTDENIIKLFRQFYRGKPDPGQALVDSIKEVIGNPTTKTGWKNAIYSTCVSGHWQAL